MEPRKPNFGYENIPDTNTGKAFDELTDAILNPTQLPPPPPFIRLTGLDRQWENRLKELRLKKTRQRKKAKLAKIARRK